MKTWIAAAGVAAALTVVAGVVAAEKWDTALEAEVETSIGTFTTEAVEGSTDYHLMLDDKELLRNEGATIFMSPVLKGKTQSFVLAFISTGGTACLGNFVVWQVKRPVTFSKQFGTCTDVYRARVEGDRLIVTMPDYAPNAEPPRPSGRPKDDVAATFTYENGVLKATGYAAHIR